MARKHNKKCCIEGCKRTATTRELCDRHYSRANDSVKAGETTWDELESFGMAGPPGKPGPKSDFRDKLAKAKAGK